MTRFIAGLSGLALAVLVLPAPAIAADPDTPTDVSAARRFHGKRYVHHRKVHRHHSVRRFTRGSRFTFRRLRAARFAQRARFARLHALRHQRHGARRHYAVARRDVSTAGLPRPLVAAIRRVQATCPDFRVISAYRPGARVRGSGRLSLHARHRAADIAGGNYRCAYRVLANFPGGMTTDAWRAKHIHLSWQPGGQEWGLRFAHGGGGHRRYARAHRRYAMTWR
jgi:uncharacterized protein YcbK (DUF882 family)